MPIAFALIDYAKKRLFATFNCPADATENLASKVICLNGCLIRLRDCRERCPKIHPQQFGLPVALQIFRPILFPISERRHGDFGMFGVCPVHRLGVVAKRLLREPFWETAFKRPLRPRIPILMQRYPANPQPITPLLELRRPIPGANGAQVGKKRPRCLTPFQEGFNLRAEPKQRRFQIRRGILVSSA